MAEGQEYSPREILIVDDSKAIRAGYEMLLPANFPEAKVHSASSPEDALHHMGSNNTIDTVITDINMQGRGLAGIELVRALRGEGFKGKIIVSSMNDSRAYAELAKSSGANDYFCKGNEIEELIGMLRRPI